MGKDPPGGNSALGGSGQFSTGDGHEGRVGNFNNKDYGGCGGSDATTGGTGKGWGAFVVESKHRRSLLI